MSEHARVATQEEPSQTFQEKSPPQGTTSTRHQEPSFVPRSHSAPASQETHREARHEARHEAPIHHTPPRDFVDRYDLPASYETTRLALIPRDPHWMYAYWDVSAPTIESVKNEVGHEFDRARQVLRVYDVTCVDFNGHNANHSFDIEVDPHAKNSYINLWKDNISYCAELGARLMDGRFVPMARSNIAQTPPTSSSWRSDEIWMDVRDKERNARFIYGMSRERDLENARRRKAEEIRRMGPKARRRLFLTEDDIRAYYSKLTPLLRDIIAQRMAKSASQRRYHTHIDAQGRRVVLDDILFKGLSRGKFVKRLLLGSSEELVETGVSSEYMTSSASEALAERGKHRKFFFEIGTELIVYGRTEPDAEVWLGDRRIPLREDGTFGLRFALPDGKIPLDFTALSHDKVDRRRIATSVERVKTVYSES